MLQSEDIRFKQAMQKFEPGSKLRRAWELKGGVSAQVVALELEQPNGQVKKMVLRRHGEVDLKHNPQIAADEFKLLQNLQAAGIAAPRPYYLDQSGEIFPTPYIIIEYIEGEAEFAPVNLDNFMLQLANQLSQIHKLDLSKLDFSFLPSQARRYTERFFKTRPVKLDESINEGQIRDILEKVWPLPQHNTTTLLHGDFWPGNVLCKSGKPVAVIDWEDAALDDPLSDLGNTRLEILWAFGIEAMQCFTGYYKSQVELDYTNLPYWDLCAALRPAFKIGEWAGDEPTEKRMREGHRWFITQAFEELAF
jgi:aminoglycoside phosphotransferase (APT) family kinase protein